MECLHGKPASCSTTSNGAFWFCGQAPSCHFFCTEDDGYRFEQAIAAWKATNQPQPQCNGHGKPAKIRIVKDPMKASYGRPYFVCSERVNPCSFWQWGDVQLPTIPTCYHGFLCASQKVKKEGVNKDRMFFCCPNEKENSCRFFEWIPEEEGSLQSQTTLLLSKSNEAKNDRNQNISLSSLYCTRNPDGTCDGDPRGHFHPF